MLKQLLKLFSRKELGQSASQRMAQDSEAEDVSAEEAVTPPQSLGERDDLGEVDTGRWVVQDGSDTDTFFGLRAAPITGEIVAENERTKSAPAIGTLSTEDEDDYSDMLEIE